MSYVLSTQTALITDDTVRPKHFMISVRCVVVVVFVVVVVVVVVVVFSFLVKKQTNIIYILFCNSFLNYNLFSIHCTLPTAKCVPIIRVSRYRPSIFDLIDIATLADNL